MKKQFFYAALAIALMSSCSKDNEPVNTTDPTPENPGVIDDTKPAEIKLGINAPNIVATRGTGTVGSTVADKNVWDGQTLGVLMYKVAADGTETLATEVVNEATKETGYIFKGLTFTAPAKDATSQLIQMHNETSLQAKYYPSTGKYAFYGYHIDDASYKEGEVAKIDTAFNVSTKTISKIEIDGSQDLLAAITAPIPAEDPAAGKPYYGANLQGADWATMANQSFSAWSARRKVQPVLEFEHKLARLKFYVKAGEKEAAAKEWKEGQWVEKNKVEVGGQQVSPAVNVTQIYVENMDNILDMTLAKATEDGASQQTVPLTLNDNSTKVSFYLKSPSIDGTKKLVDLIPTAPEYYYDEKNEAANGAEGFSETTPIGESLMFFPNGDSETQIQLQIALTQAVVDTYTLEDGNEVPKTHIVKSDILPYTLKASDIKLNGTPIEKFKPGESYDITIKVYGYQRIEITASLSAWKEGGNVEVSPGDTFTE